jgi:bacillithiol system protein YtxJ
VERPLRLRSQPYRHTNFMKWIELNSEQKLAQAKDASNEKPVVLFKHSTTCSISKTVLNRIERNWNEQEIAGTKAYYLDLLAHRNISNEIAHIFGVEHQSPQVLIIDKGKSVYNRSHFDIEYASIKKEIDKISGH